MQQLVTDAIVLKSLPLKECDKLLTLFTLQAGLIKLYVRGRKWSQSALTSPFTRGEYLCSRGRSDLFRFQEGKIIHPYLHLRDSLSALLMAEKMGHFLEHMNEENPNQELYHLFSVYLEGLKTSVSKESFFAAFFLKALSIEGLLQKHAACSKCKSPLGEKNFRYRGERFCEKDAVEGAIFFAQSEEKKIEILLKATFKEAELLSLDPSFLSKIDKLLLQVEHF